MAAVPYRLSDEQSRAFAKAFKAHSDGNHVDVKKAEKVLGSLPEGTRGRIFYLADLDRDGRLSLREFVYAMFLADLVKSGKELPKPDMAHQEEMMRSVERYLAKGKALPPTAGLLPETFTADPVPPSSADATLARLKTAVTQMIDITRSSDQEIDKLADDVLEARKKLNDQLLQREAAESALRDARLKLDQMHDARRTVEKDTSVNQRRLTHLQDELEYLGIEVGSANDDLQMLADLASGVDAVSPGGQEYSALEIDMASVPELEGMLKSIGTQKKAQQALLQKEIEKQRQIEQDRSLMVMAIETERQKLSQLRAERMRLCEDRFDLEKQLTEIALKHWQAQNAGIQANASPKSGGAPGGSSNPPVKGIKFATNSAVVYASTSTQPAQAKLSATDPRANTSIFTPGRDARRDV